MNEQFAQDVFAMAAANGYNGSSEEFNKMLLSNIDFQSDLFAMALSNGYKNDKDVFLKELGIDADLKKKETTQPSTTTSTPTGSTTPQQQSPSQQGIFSKKDYDYDSAKKYGITPDETGHWQSRVPETGLILKSENHPTFQKTIKGEQNAGYSVYRNVKDGRIYSFPNDQSVDNSVFKPYNVSQQGTQQPVFGESPTSSQAKTDRLIQKKREEDPYAGLSAQLNQFVEDKQNQFIQEIEQTKANIELDIANISSRAKSIENEFTIEVDKRKKQLEAEIEKITSKEYTTPESLGTANARIQMLTDEYNSWAEERQKDYESKINNINSQIKLKTQKFESFSKNKEAEYNTLIKGGASSIQEKFLFDYNNKKLELPRSEQNQELFNTLLLVQKQEGDYLPDPNMLNASMRKEAYMADRFAENVDMENIYSSSIFKFLEKQISLGYLSREDGVKFINGEINYNSLISKVTDGRIEKGWGGVAPPLKTSSKELDRKETERLYEQQFKDEILSYFPEEYRKSGIMLSRLEDKLWKERDVFMDFTGDKAVGGGALNIPATFGKFISDLAFNVSSVSYDLAAELVDAVVPETKTVMGTFRIGDALRTLAEGAREDKQRVSEFFGKEIRQVNKGIIEAVEDVDLSSFFNLSLQAAAGSISVMIPTAMVGASTKNPYATYLTMTALGAAQAYEDVRNEEPFKQLTTEQKGLYFLQMGAFEAVGEMAGYKFAKQVFKDVAKKATKEFARKSLKDFVKATAAVYGMNMAENQLGELTTTLGQYLTEKAAYGGDISFDELTERFKETVVSTLGMDLLFTAVGAGGKTLNYISAKTGLQRNESLKTKLKEDFLRLQGELIREDLTTDEKSEIAVRLLNIKKEYAKISKQEEGVLRIMEEQDIRELISLNDSKKKLQTKIGQTSSEVLKEELNKELADIDSKISQIEEKYANQQVTNQQVTPEVVEQQQFEQQLTPEELEAKKADIQKRRQEELNQYDQEGLKETYTVGSEQTVEEYINAKYDAELSALEQQSQKTPTETPATPAAEGESLPQQETTIATETQRLEGRRVTYLDPSTNEVIDGELVQDGKTLTVQTDDGRIVEVKATLPNGELTANVDAIQENGLTLEEIGIKEQQPYVVANEDGTFTYNRPDNMRIKQGTKLVDNKGGVKAIRKNNKGEIIGVELSYEDGTTAPMLKGQDAVDAAYQIQLRELQTQEQENRVSDEIRKEIEQEYANISAETTKVTDKETAGNIEQTQVTDDTQAKQQVPSTKQEGKATEQAKPKQKPSGKEAKAGRDVQTPTKEEVELRGEPTIRAQRLQEIAEIAFRSIKKMYPNLKINIYSSTEEFMRGTNDKRKGVKGTFDGNTNTININAEIALDTTVAHEVFHAVLFQALGGLKNKNIERIVMLSSEQIVRVLLRTLDKNSSQYKEIVRLKKIIDEAVQIGAYSRQDAAEEVITNTIEFLQKNFDSLKPRAIQVIKEALNRISKALRLPPMFEQAAKDREVLDFLNSYVQNVTVGGDITAVGEAISKYSESELAQLNEIFTPSSSINGAVNVKDSKEAYVEGLDTTPPKVTSERMVYPEGSTVQQVLDRSGGAIMFVNSDGTKVGSVVVNGRKLNIQGGIDYTFIEGNTKNNIGFAASNMGKVSNLDKVAQELIAERDAKTPQHKGKPVAVFVVSQNASAVLGEWYSSEYIMEGIDAALSKKKYRGGLRAAKSDFVQAILSVKLGKSKDGKSDLAAREKLIGMIRDGKFDTHSGRLEIAERLSSSEFSFAFRKNLNESILASNARTANSGKNIAIKKALVDVGHFIEDVYNKFIDERLLSLTNKQKSPKDKDSATGGITFSGFMYDPYSSLESKRRNATNGINHRQFNFGFTSTETFLLDRAMDVNRWQPNMGFPTSAGRDAYNRANNAQITEQSPITDKNKVSKWLNENNLSSLVVSPYTSISQSMYTAINASEEVSVSGKSSIILPENSSNFASMTEDEDGNFVFFHVGDRGYKEIRPASGATRFTSRQEAAAIGKVGGVAMYYTSLADNEMTARETHYAVSLPKESVYDADADPNGYYERGKELHEIEHKGMGYDGNTQVAYITKLAINDGYKMVVARWKNSSRAQTTLSLQPTDEMQLSLNTITKDFDGTYTSNKGKYEIVDKESRQSALAPVYTKIDKELVRGDFRHPLAELSKMSFYTLGDKYAPFKTQEQITEAVMSSDIPKKYKDEYMEALERPLETGKSVPIRSSIDLDAVQAGKNVMPEVGRLKKLPRGREDGSTVNIDGTKYDGGGLVVPVISYNTTQKDLSVKDFVNFIVENIRKISNSDVFKLGFYKFENSEQISIDLNIVVPRKHRAVAIEFGRQAGQKKLFDLDTYEYVDTGADGLNPASFTDEQFAKIGEALSKGEMPKVGLKSSVNTQMSKDDMELDDHIRATPRTKKTTLQRVREFLTEDKSRVLGFATKKIVAALNAKEQIESNMAQTNITSLENARRVKKLKNAAISAVARANGISKNDARVIVEKLMNNVLAPLDNKTTSADAIAELSAISKKLAVATLGLRTHIDTMTDLLMKSPAFKNVDAETRKRVLENIGNYLHREYLFFLDKSYEPSDTLRRRAIQLYAAENNVSMKEAIEYIESLIGQWKKVRNPIVSINNKMTTASLKTKSDAMKKRARRPVNADLWKEAGIFAQKKYKGVKNSEELKYLERIEYYEMNGGTFQELPDYLRDLLGEIKEPTARYINTMMAMGDIYHKSNAMKQLVEDYGDGKWIRKDKPHMSDIENFQQINDKYSPLNGMWVHRKIIEEFNVKPLYKTDTIFLNTYYWIQQLLRKSKILPNPATWLKNITGGYFSQFANGDWMLTRDPSSIASSMWGRFMMMTKNERNDFVKRIWDDAAKAGVLATGIDLRTLAYIDDMYRSIETGDELIFNRSLKTLAKMAKQAPKQVDEGLGKRYAQIDDYTKAISVMLQKEVVSVMMFDMEYSSLTESQKLEVLKETGSRVKRGYPTFSRLPSFFSFIAKLPMGDFLSFSFESSRAFAGSNIIGFEDAAAAATGKKDGKTLSATQRSEYAKSAARRFFASSTLIAITTMIKLGIMGRDDDDDDTDEQKALKKSVLTSAPDWASGRALVIKNIKPDGTVSFYDYSGQDPYAETISMLSGDYKSLENLMNGSMMWRLIVESSTGEDQVGRRIYTKDESTASKTKKIAKHFGKAFVPPIVSSVVWGKEKMQSADPDWGDANSKGMIGAIGDYAALTAGRATIRDYQYNVYKQATYLAYKINSDDFVPNLEQSKTVEEIDIRINNLINLRDYIRVAILHANAYPTNELSASYIDRLNQVLNDSRRFTDFERAILFSTDEELPELVKVIQDDKVNYTEFKEQMREMKRGR